MAIPSLSLFNNVIPSGFGLAFVILEEYYPFGGFVYDTFGVHHFFGFRSMLKLRCRYNIIALSRSLKD